MSERLSRRRFLRTGSVAAAGAAAIAATGTAVALTVNEPDAELLRLGTKFEHLWATERAAEADGHAYEPAFDASRAVVLEIERWQATTLAGLQVKARAVLWCYCGDVADVLDNDQGTTDFRLASGIIRDLLAGGFAL